MRPTLIDLNDSELRISRGVDELARSPGYATLVDHKIEIGETGHANAWRAPRQSHHGFWQLLDTTPLAQLGKRVRHAGDLAYLHLAHLRERGGRPSSAIFIVPGAYQRAQLSLLLGIAQAAGLQVEALVDSAVAVGATLPPGRYTHVETSLAHSTITRLEVDERRATRTHIEIVEETGFTHFEQRIIDCIVAAFLKSSRFDALHDALTEQLLHTHLAQWLGLLAEQPEITLNIDYRGVRHAARLRREVLAEALAPLGRILAERAGAGHILLDYRLRALPGLTTEWAAQVLPANAALTGCTHSPDLTLVDSSGVTLRTALAVVPTAVQLVLAPARRHAREPRRPPLNATHVVHEHVAYPLSMHALYLTARGTVERSAGPDVLGKVMSESGGARVEILSGTALQLNGQVLNGSTSLAPGDRLAVSGTPLVCTLISVRRDDAL